MEQYLPDTFGGMTGAFNAGRLIKAQRKADDDKQQFRTLAAQAMKGDPSATAQAYALDPASAKLVDEGAQRMGLQLHNIANQLKQFHAQGNEQAAAMLYQQAAPMIRQKFPNAPEQWDANALMPAIDAVVAMTTPAEQPNANSVHSAFRGQNGNMWVLGRDGQVRDTGAKFDPNMQVFDTGDGVTGINRTNATAVPITMAGQQPQQPQQPQAPQMPTDSGVPAQPGAMLDPTKDFPQLASLFPGTAITSLARSPADNTRVDGVPNSQHLKGTAGDFVVPPPLQAAFIAKAREMGYEVDDERNRPGHGPHIHLELPRGAQASGQFAPGQQLRSAPSPTEQMHATELAAKQTRNLTPEEVAARGYRPGTIVQVDGFGDEQVTQTPPAEAAGGRLSATALRQVNAAKAKLIDLQAVKNQLQLVQQKFQPLQNSLSAGPFGGGLIPSEDGKRYDAAVSLLQQFVRKLTRTPGEGSMSDWEGKLAMLANPSRNDYESVTQDKIDQLGSLVDQITQGYTALLQDNQGEAAGQRGPAPGTIEDGHRFKGGNPADPNNWEAVN
jgi:hypothetical protein